MSTCKLDARVVQRRGERSALGSASEEVEWVMVDLEF